MSALSDYEIRLIKQIRQYFRTSDSLEELCLDLGIIYENLSGDTPRAKAQSLVIRCSDENRIEDLITVCAKQRAHVAWSKPPDTIQPQSEPVKTQPEPPSPPPMTNKNLLWYKRLPGWGWALVGLALGVILIGIVWAVSSGLGNRSDETAIALATEEAVAQATTDALQATADAESAANAQATADEFQAAEFAAAAQATTDALQATADAAQAEENAQATDDALPAIADTPAITPTPELGPGSTIVREKDGMVMVYVPAGEFMMGSDDAEDDEKPAHVVNLDNYWIDQTEVTNGMYTMCVRDGVCERPSSLSSNERESYYPNPAYTDYPVIYVSWNDANTYCEWADGRLPTEAQWEKAARWDDETQKAHTYPWGETISCNDANYNRCVGDTTAVGSYPDGVSPYGALDMAGNVWEWVADWYDVDYYAELIYDNPTGPTDGSRKGLRGGSWFFNAVITRSANRSFGLDPTYRYFYIGFRCASLGN